MTLKQRVPIAKTAEGKEVFVTLEWLKDLNATFTSATATTSATDTTALAASLSALQSDLTALTARVKKLEGGYQV